ncbi:MAG TPA: hypothetical protein VFI22_10420, partial [Thermomicrobiales bacterium]|nr:hypothetical protein [Thermomicrobiales bacterium]
QIVRGVPADETGSAMSFYQVLRSVGFSAGSALSATILVAFMPPDRSLPTDAGYSAAAIFGIAILLVAFAVAIVFARSETSAARPERVEPAPTGR